MQVVNIWQKMEVSSYFTVTSKLVRRLIVFFTNFVLLS